MFHVKPIDPRLFRYARATRFFLMAVVALGAVGAVLVVAQAMLVAEIVVGGFEDGLSVSDLRTPLILLVAVAAGRALVAWLTELAAYRASAAVKSELRGGTRCSAARRAVRWTGARQDPPGPPWSRPRAGPSRPWVLAAAVAR